jgi:hypothetical protein
MTFAAIAAEVKSAVRRLISKRGKSIKSSPEGSVRGWPLMQQQPQSLRVAGDQVISIHRIGRAMVIGLERPCMLRNKIPAKGGSREELRQSCRSFWRIAHAAVNLALSSARPSASLIAH